MEDLNYQGFWNETLKQMRAELGEEEFGGWFTDIKYLRGGKNSIVLGFPSGFHRDRIIKHYQKTIKTKLNTLSGTAINLEFEVIPDSETETNLTETENPVKETPETTPSAPENSEKIPKKQHPQMLEDYTFEKYGILGTQAKQRTGYFRNSLFLII